MVIQADLEQLVTLSGVELSCLEELFALLKAPDDLTHLRLVLENVNRALQAVQGTQRIREDLDDATEKKEEK